MANARALLTPVRAAVTTVGADALSGQRNVDYTGLPSVDGIGSWEITDVNVHVKLKLYAYEDQSSKR